MTHQLGVLLVAILAATTAVAVEVKVGNICGQPCDGCFGECTACSRHGWCVQAASLTDDSCFGIGPRGERLDIKTESPIEVKVRGFGTFVISPCCMKAIPSHLGRCATTGNRVSMHSASSDCVKSWAMETSPGRRWAYDTNAGGLMKSFKSNDELSRIDVVLACPSESQTEESAFEPKPFGGLLVARSKRWCFP